ncbi:MAG: hypothetical protein QOK28_2981 [Actinomycetota bacterium]|jgi:hypothetical protein
MTRTARRGEGTAWLVADSSNDEFLCYWYFGTGGGRLAEQARVSSERGAVAWGRERSTRVRLRSTNGRTYWAGSDDKPDAIAHTWEDHNTTAPTGPVEEAAVRVAVHTVLR